MSFSTVSHAQFLTGLNDEGSLLDTPANNLPSSQNIPAAKTPVTQREFPKFPTELPNKTQTTQTYSPPSSLNFRFFTNSSVSDEALKQEKAVNLNADSLSYNDETKTVTAAGNVVMQQEGKTLRAEKISYNTERDFVQSEGHVTLLDRNGDRHDAEDVELEGNFSKGRLKNLQTRLADGSHFTAKEGICKSATETVMKSAAYTPCEICIDGQMQKAETPVWQIKASEVIHDEENKRIKYKNARFEVLGAPIAYTPFFSHPDGSVRQEDGFLPPVFGFDSDLGVFAGTSYYWGIDSSQDFTLGLTAFTNENPQANAQYRKRWNDAYLQIDGSATVSDFEDNQGDDTVTQTDENRGHLFAEGLWNINEQYRAGLNVELASDDQYLRQYEISSKDVLENELFLERFSGRNYAVARALAFQDVRIRENQEDQPNILPEIQANLLGNPGEIPLIGGRWSLDSSYLGLRREGDEQDVDRLSLDAGWERRLISDYGLVTHLDLSMRGDVYKANDREIADIEPGRSSDSTATQLFPQAHIQTGYPLVNTLDAAQVTIEPLIAATFAPNIDIDEDIPNEDSVDIQIDPSNLFEPNRFPGLDRVEDRSRVTYGIQTGLYGFSGDYFQTFLGQSYRIDDDDNPFPEGSGLNEQSSDVVGEVSAGLNNALDVNYRFQLSSENLASERHEVDFIYNLAPYFVGINYLFANELEGTEIDESREQIRGNFAYDINENWRVRNTVTQDLGARPGLRQATLGIDFFGQCLSWTLTGVRNLTDDASGDSSTEILFQIGLKNLTEFQESRLKKEACFIADSF